MDLEFSHIAKVVYEMYRVGERGPPTDGLGGPIRPAAALHDDLLDERAHLRRQLREEREENASFRRQLSRSPGAQKRARNGVDIAADDVATTATVTAKVTEVTVEIIDRASADYGGAVAGAAGAAGADAAAVEAEPYTP
eukprot:CAMPEP_0173223930 /NCGR_PEP_ID=MMETSP1142-20121109/4054_1 /TAXON_ID=483371 /ORGANISM="non described non described, Strain CCMP2298" /LENGTH=138 /DNA_ID=CAMNT_0014152135 /DNA_START=142 /DNA_END=556 /DNA_ORIENTATION=+